jgi:hypothetical protein
LSFGTVIALILTTLMALTFPRGDPVNPKINPPGAGCTP